MKIFRLPLIEIVFFISIFFFGCSKKETTTEIPKTEFTQVQQQLDKIMSPETIGIQQAFFEKTFGPAKRISGNVFNYEIGTCSVNIEYIKNSITSVELDGISKVCNFNGKNLYLNSMANQINYSELIGVAMDWNADLSCYTSCGNAADPEYGAHIETARVYGNIEFEATTNYAEAGEASNKVEEFFRRKYPNIDLFGGDLGIISKEEYNKIWIEKFKDIKLTSIKFGYNLKNIKN